MAMLYTSEIDMANTINDSDIADFLTTAAWAVRSTYHSTENLTRCGNIWKGYVD
jgi:hypothetical protein